MKLDIMGLQFDNVTMDEAAARALLRKEARDVADWHLG